MNKVLLTFSNGETLELCENQLIVPISKLIVNDDVSVSQCPTYELWYHSGEGFIPSVCELLCKCDFFQLKDDPNKCYNSKSVVTIKNL
jgi:hypothetical protein